MKGFKLICLKCGAENIITDESEIQNTRRDASIYVFEDMSGKYEIECNKCGNKL